MAFALSGSSDGATYSPINVSGFNVDPVVEADANFRAYYMQGYNATIDNGPYAYANTFYEQGFCTIAGSTNVNRAGLGSTGTTGLPHPGWMITKGNYTFQMAATYAGNDCLLVGNYPTGIISNGAYSSPNYFNGSSFTVTVPQAYSGFSILTTAGNGPCVMNYTVSYSDGNTDSGTVSAINWRTERTQPAFLMPVGASPWTPSGLTT